MRPSEPYHGYIGQRGTRPHLFANDKGMCTLWEVMSHPLIHELEMSTDEIYAICQPKCNQGYRDRFPDETWTSSLCILNRMNVGGGRR